MTLSTSRQQFLSYETQHAEDIQYGRRGGIFVSTCICIIFVLLAILFAVVVGVIVYFVSHHVLSQQSLDFWDETEPFGQDTLSSKHLRLSADIIPSFYRLKKKVNLDNSTFSGKVYITIRAKKNVNKIILHSKGLSINNNVKVSEQVYEKLETNIYGRRKRQTSDNATELTAQTFGTNKDTTDEHKNVTNTENKEPTVESKNTTIESKQMTGDNKEKVIEKSETTGDVKKNLEEKKEKLEETKEKAATEEVSTTNKTTNATIPAETIASSTPTEENVVTQPATSITNATIQNEEPTRRLQTHQVTQGSVRNIPVKSITNEEVGDQLIVNLGKDLHPEVDYILEISFNGTITDMLTGLYRSKYMGSDNKQKFMGVTQFEPISARSAFPCFDQPEFKAKFEISIAHKKELTVLSNMKVASQEDIDEEPGWRWTHFDRSVNMSTYLVAYTLSEFQNLETSYVSKDNVTKYIRVWAQPGLIAKAKYAVTITPKLLEFYENVFGVPYALDKIDLIAIPDFSSGAMENWGLMTFRETTLLFDEKENVPHDKQSVAIDIAHELAHQWFGNLVTMTWWTDLWLNEGFATYIEYIGVSHIEPDWHMLEEFTRDKMDLLRSDALKNTSPVSREVIDASEISQKFDEISYSKGASLIRMLNHTITHELFHQGLVLYLNKWKYTNAEENDLWASMSEATKSDPFLKDISVVEFMNSWTRQAGYPVVNVKRNYNTGEVIFEQKLFSAAKDPYKKMVNQLWHIPISYTTVDAPTDQWATKPKLWLNTQSAKLSIPAKSTQALYVNVDAIGYYRVNYDSQNWELLSKALKNGQMTIPLTRAQLIDDAFNLAKVGQLEYSYALDLTTYVIGGEDSKVVWDLLLNNMAFLRYNLRTSPFYVYFQDYIKKLLSTQLKKVNYGLDKPKDDTEAFLIENLVMWECYVESERCLHWARDQFDKWVSQPHNNTIPSYLRPLVYSMALRHGGRPEFDFLWKVFESTTDPNVKNIIINNIASTRDESLIAWLLEKSLTDIPNQYAPAVWNVDTPIAFKIAQDFLINNWDRVYKKFTQMDTFLFPAVLNGAFGFITSKEELNKVKSFALQHKEELMSMSQTLQKIVDTANLRINWLEKHSASIERWLKQYVTANGGLPIFKYKI